MTTAVANSTTTGTLYANQLLRVLGNSIVTIVRDGAIIATQSTDRDNFAGPYPTDTTYSVVAGGAAVSIDLVGSGSGSGSAVTVTTNASGGVSLAGTAYPELGGASPSATAAVNTAAIQAALNSGGSVEILTPGTYKITAPALVGSNTKLRLGAGVMLRTGTTVQGVTVRTGNAEFTHQAVENGLTILGAETQAGGTGQLSYTPGTTSLAWKAPGDSGFGTPVNIGSTIGKYKIPSATAGKALWITFSATSALLATATYNVAVASFNGITSVALSRTTNVVTATEASHGRKSGDLIQIYGDAAFTGSHLIERLSADTYSYTHTGSNGTSTGAVVYAMNNIELDFTGAIINGAVVDDENPATTSPGAGTLKNCIVLRNANQVNVYGGHSKAAMKYAVVISACSNWRVHDWTADTGSDTIHPLSPLINGEIYNIISKGGDNVIGLGNADYPGQTYDLPGESGYYDAKGTSIRNIRGINTNQDIVRLYGCDTTGAFRDTLIDGVHGTFTATGDAAVAIYTDTALTMVSAGNQRNNIYGLRIKNITAKCADSTVEKRQVYFAATSGETNNKFNIEIDGVLMSPNGATGGNKGSVYINCSMHNPIIKGLQPNSNPWGGHGVYLGASAAISGKLDVSGVSGNWSNAAYAVSGAPAIVLVDQTGSTADEIDLHDFSVRDVSTGGQATNGIFVTNNGIAAAVVRDGYAGGFKNLIEFAGASNAPKFTVHDIVGSVITNATPTVLKSNSIGYTANISNLSGAFNDMIYSYSASGAVKIRTSNTGNASYGGVAGLNIASNTSATYDVDGDLKAPLYNATATLQISRTTGNMVRSLAVAGTIPAGARAVCDDSGAANSWKAVHNTTLVY
jgi:hypothetical protein